MNHFILSLVFISGIGAGVAIGITYKPTQPEPKRWYVIGNTNFGYWYRNDAYPKGDPGEWFGPTWVIEQKNPNGTPRYF